LGLLVQGVKLHCIIDACHSGSVMDLPFQVSRASGSLLSDPETSLFARLHGIN
jgi:hypothetical protein